MTHYSVQNVLWKEGRREGGVGEWGSGGVGEWGSRGVGEGRRKKEWERGEGEGKWKRERTKEVDEKRRRAKCGSPM